MAIPTFDKFIEPLLRYLATQPDGVSAGDASEAVADLAGVTIDERQQLLPSGIQQIYKNRIGWAHDRLKRAGLSSSPRRGFWQITPTGQKFVGKHSKALPAEEVRRLAFPHRKAAASGRKSSDEELDEAAGSFKSPEERIEDALRELRESVVHELLDFLSRVNPTSFEYIVLEVLNEMGYGTSRDDLERVGGSGDGGIDGIISLDKLGLEKVYVQAKRWKSDVGSAVIREFVGGLQLKGADKGVLITTSTFTKDARDAAERARGSVVLVDGRRLAQLMIDHEVGVTHQKRLTIPKVDSDYFDGL
jgi:restriction system protein